MSADFWAGYISGAASIVIGNPLDLIKVRLQSGTRTTTASAPASPSSTPTSGPLTPTSGPQTANAPVRRVPHFARSLFAGLPAPILTYGALNALLFTSYNRVLTYFPASPSSAISPITSSSVTNHYSPFAHFTAGALAGLATFVISTPTELIKCRAQLASPFTGASSSSWHIAQSTLVTQGLRGLYVGGVVTSVRDAVGYGFYFWAYEAASAAFARRASKGRDGQLGPAMEAGKVLLCGGLAGVATWASIFPLDVVKTRVQTQALADPTAAAVDARVPLLAGTQRQRLRYPGALEVARQAYAAEGLHVFFRGLTVCCVRAFLVNAVQWAVYEWVMKVMLPQPTVVPHSEPPS